LKRIGTPGKPNVDCRLENNRFCSQVKYGRTQMGLAAAALWGVADSSARV
jgi:hypothetical protein